MGGKQEENVKFICLDYNIVIAFNTVLKFKILKKNS